MKTVTNKKSIVQKTITFLLLFFIACAGFTGGVSFSNISTDDEQATVSAAELPLGSGTTYYVSSSTGNDSNNGTSEATPWQTLAKVNSTTFSAGQNILLKSGDYWLGFLAPKGEGASGSPITLGKYGSGTAYPHIHSDSSNPNTSKADPVSGSCILPTAANLGTSEALYGTVTGYKYHNPVVLLANQSYWTVQNLELSNSSSGRVNIGILVLTHGNGITKTLTNQSTNDITLRDNYIHDVTFIHRSPKPSGGIVCSGLGRYWNGDVVSPAPSKNNSNIGFNGLYITNNKIINVSNVGIRTSGNNVNSDAVTETMYKNGKKHRNVVVSDNYIDTVPCDGIVMSEITNGSCERNIVRNAANKNPTEMDTTGLNFAGIWATSCDNVVFRYNEVYGIRYGYNDGEAFDFDNNVTNIIFEYNFSHDNNGGLVNVMHETGLPTSTSGSGSGNIFRYNISANDAFNNYNVGDESLSDETSGMTGQGIFHQATGYVKVYNNTIWNNGSKTVSVLGASTGVGGENKANYYYYNNLTAGTFFRATSGYWNTGSNNLNLTVAQTADYLVNPSGYAADPNISYETRGVGDEYVRLFRQRISYFQLKPAATANIINKGVTQATFALGNSDVYGNVLSDTADIGAHEFNTSLYNQLTTARNALSSAISAQSAYIQSDWSPESWTVYQGLLTAPSAISVKANAILSDGSVSDALIAQTANPASAAVDINKLNDAATTVTNAHNVLVSGIVGAKQLLQAALDALPTNLVDTDYTEATWTVYAEKIADARSVLANSNSIPDVNAATATVKAAGGHLVTRVSVSRPALLAALNALPVRTESEYTAATWAIYYPTVQNAWAVYNNSSATAPQLDAAKDTLVGIDGVLVTKISVARTNLSDAIAALPTLDADLYTPLSWAAYQAVITNAKSVLNNNNSTLAQLEAELPKLASAEDKLETKAHAEQEAFLAAREALRIALAGMPILTPSDYIEASYNEYLAVISAAQAVYDKNGAATLSELQSAKNSLATASNKLVYKLDIAKALLVTTLAGMLVGKDPIDYTESSWADYLAIIADAQAVSDDGNATLSEINDAIYALDHANESLVRNVTIALANLLAALNALLPTPTESLYTADSYAAYTAVVDAAWSEYNKGTASTVEALEAALATLTGVKTLLVTKVSAAKAELAARIAAIKVYNDTVLVKDNYTNDSWTTYLIIITSAEYVRDNGTALEAFEAAIASLDTAESKLETKTAAALKALANALDKLPNLNEGDYTEASWIAYQDIITDAHGYNNGGSTLAELEAAIAALASAKNVLVTKLSVAKIALANALDKLPTLVKADYTNDSWAAYQAIITAAKTVYADVRSTLTAYETATASLATAQSVLTVKEVPPPPIDEVEIPNVTDKITLNRDAEYAMSVDVKAGATIVGYSSSDDKIATVDENGKITAHRKGTATITATDSNGETYILSVTVKFNFWQWLMYIICFGWIWM